MEKLLNNPYNTVSIEYRLAISPSRVMEIVLQHTEKLSSAQRLFPFSIKENVQFWSRFDSDDIFKISRKWSAKGYSNSFAPWLVGWVKPAKEGSSVRIFFEMDENVSRLNKYSFILLIFFTTIIGWMFVGNAFFRRLTDENIIGAVFIAVFWIFLFGIRKIGFNLGQKDKAVLLEFFEGLFKSYYVQ